MRRDQMQYETWMEQVPHTVREFGVEARRDHGAWELAFNGPTHQWYCPVLGENRASITVRLSRIKDHDTLELMSVNLVFFCSQAWMSGVRNVYDFAREVPFTVLDAPPALIPEGAGTPNDSGWWYEANPEGVILEDVRQTPITLPNGNPGWFVTGQGYRGKLHIGPDDFLHDVGVYGGFLDLTEFTPRLTLGHLFGGLRFLNIKQAEEAAAECQSVHMLSEHLFVTGAVKEETGHVRIQSFKNSVLLPRPKSGNSLIGARSMSETKSLTYFTSGSPLTGYTQAGKIEGLEESFPEDLWARVRRVGLGSNFLSCPELGGYVGMVHVVFDVNHPEHPRTHDHHHPRVNEAYEGWAVLLRYDSQDAPHVHAVSRVCTADDRPTCYEGRTELFKTKRVAFPMSLYRSGLSNLRVGYGWGDRALFEVEFKYDDLVKSLSGHIRG